MNERTVGAVFQQAAHKIGQQFAVPSDRRIGAAGKTFFADEALMQAFAHAMQTLEFEVTALAGPVYQGGDGQGIMAGKGGINMGRIEHVTRAGEIGNIGRRLACKERVVAQAIDLGLFDLGIPVGALDQTNEETFAGGGAQGFRPADQRPTALAIGLDGHAEPFPARKLRIAGHALNDIQRHHQALGFLGINGQTDTEAGGLTRQTGHHFGQFGHAPVGIGDLIARMQGGQLDGDIMARHLFRRANRGDGVLIGCEITFGVFIGTGGFTQHVETGGEACIFRLGGAIERFIDVTAHNENRAHQAHGGGDTGTNEGFTSTGQQTFERPAIFRHEGTRQHQAEGSGIDQF